jgi:hypothetical protein
MAAPDQTPFKNWWLNVVGAQVPWLAGGPNGQAEANAWPSVYDYIIGLLYSARYQAYPDLCASDALSHLGGDRGLVEGPTETDANFRIRIKTAWGNSPITLPSAQTGLPAAQSGGPSSGWALAGTWLQLLEELYWGGFSGAVIVQQNGLGYSLSGAPTAGADNHALLTIAQLSVCAAQITSSVTPPTLTQTGRSIPPGNSWWLFDYNTDYCNRFAILFPNPPSVFVTIGRATFTAADNAVVTWNNSFPDTTYIVSPGPPVVTDGGGPVTVSADSTTKTTTGITIRASAPFNGYVDVHAWQVGANPFADLHPADLARLQFIIKTWRPNALCTGVIAVAQGRLFGWPVITFGSAYVSAPYSIATFAGA